MTNRTAQANILLFIVNTLLFLFTSGFKANKPVVDVARDAQRCAHTRDSSVTDRHTDGRTDTV